jgi:hypothetical protein
MAEAIRHLYTRDLDALGRAARQRVLSCFTWTHSLNLQLASYAGVLTGGRSLPAPAAETALELELSAVEDR